LLVSFVLHVWVIVLALSELGISKFLPFWLFSFSLTFCKPGFNPTIPPKFIGILALKGGIFGIGEAGGEPIGEASGFGFENGRNIETARSAFFVFLERETLYEELHEENLSFSDTNSCMIESVSLIFPKSPLSSYVCLL
jgi:hypothetical protein